MRWMSWSCIFDRATGLPGLHESDAADTASMRPVHDYRAQGQPNPPFSAPVQEPIQVTGRLDPVLVYCGGGCADRTEVTLPVWDGPHDGQ